MKKLQNKILSHNQSSITLYPERGGIITSMRIRETELLYQGMLDETLHDMTKSVRGGIPILFPNAGFLTDEEKSQSGWSLPQHGFARTNEWRFGGTRHCEAGACPVAERGSNPGICHAEEGDICSVCGQGADSSYLGMTKNHNQVIQSLSSSNVPDMFGYEWNGTIENTIVLSDKYIELRYSIANNSDKELPISLGLHPYWDVPFGDKSQIQWNFAGGDIIGSDIDNWSRGGTTRIDVPDNGIVSFTIPGVGAIELHLSPEFGRLWIWSLPDKNFVCVEPVMGDDGNIVRSPVRIPVVSSMTSTIKIVFYK